MTHKKTHDPNEAVLSSRKFGKKMVILPFTTEEYWDCECDEDYIHRSFEFMCPKCKARREDQPDARTIEVLAAGLKIDNLCCAVF